MRRALMSLILLLAWPAAADAATVKVVDCVPALDPITRSATFDARMRASKGSERLQLRFTLQVREAGLLARWRKVVAPGFDEWLTSEAGVRRYSYTRTIQNLTAPASYRTIVRFRWLDAEGAVLRSSRVTSGACRQPDLRPDLVAMRVETAPGPEPDTTRYRVLVRNGGRTDAGAFDVAAGDALAHVTGLAAGTQQVVAFTGPACTPELPITLDPEDTVDERDEDDNVVLAAICP